MTLVLPVLADERVRLRAFDAGDLGLIQTASIADASSNHAVGQIGLWPRAVDSERASIGYWLGMEFRGKGYASAALRLVTNWAFESGMDRLELAVEPWNKDSWRLAETIGFQREGLMRRWQRVGNDRKDMYLYAMINPDAQSRPSPG